MKNARLWALAIAVLVIVGGVAAYFLLYEGAVAVYVKDAPGAWDHVWVTFSGVAIHESGQDNASWKNVSSTQQTVDLASLTNVSQLLGKVSLNPGHYEQIRLSVVKVTGQLNGSTQIVNITLPPDNATLKIVGQFTISSGQTTAVTVDIRLAQSLHDVNGTWVFTPVFGMTVG
jgi:hypothetical protein